MRIAIVGATGNIGSALLEELHGREEVSSLLGIARRLPQQDAVPYTYAEWSSADIQFPESVETLTELFDGADAVVHLAWLIQPNSKRELLRRVNVQGTKHVLEAAAAAGVSRVAVASSVGAYSPVSDDAPGTSPGARREYRAPTTARTRLPRNGLWTSSRHYTRIQPWCGSARG